MPRPGPKRIPQALKAIAGEDRPCRRRPSLPTDPVDPALAKPPRWLKGLGLAEWRKQLPLLCAAGVAPSDLSMFGMYCGLFGQVEDMLRKGIEVKASMMGQLRALAASNGLTFADRLDVHRGPGKPPENAFARNARAPQGLRPDRPDLRPADRSEKDTIQ